MRPDSTSPRIPLAWLALALAAPAAEGQAPQPSRTQAQAPARQVPEALSFAHRLYQGRRFDLAAEEYEKFLKSGQARAEADSADAWYYLGNARLFLEQYQEARKAYEEFLRVAPDHPNGPTARYRVGGDVVRPGGPPGGPQGARGLRRGRLGRPPLPPGGLVAPGGRRLPPERPAGGPQGL